MKYYKIFSAMLIMLMAFSVAGHTYVLIDQQPDIKPVNEVVVVLQDSASISFEIDKNGVSKSSSVQINQLNSIHGVKSFHKVSKIADKMKADHPLNRLYVVQLEDGADLEQVSKDYENLEIVKYAFPNRPVISYTTPADSLYGDQWALHNTGQSLPYIDRIDGYNNDTLGYMSGVSDADIDANEVFSDPPANLYPVVVAVIDGGVDINHIDIQDNIWTNPYEIAANGIDDDWNGYVDDVHGWNFLLDTSDVEDYNGHGTHIAGTIGASQNDNGIVGVYPGCKILPLRHGFITHSVEALYYAAYMHVDIINMSWGLAPGSSPEERNYLEEAINYVHDQGVILVAASGNDGMLYYNYPSSFENVISVGATNFNDQVTVFSTWNDSLDLVAPGESILSLRADGTDMYTVGYEPDVHIYNDIYYLASGTSMASPHVAGAAAYLRAVSPGISHEKVLEILSNTADDIVEKVTESDTISIAVGNDIYSANGRINLNAALAAVPDVQADITSPDITDIYSGSITITGTADWNEVGITEYTVEYGVGVLPTSWNNITTSSQKVNSGTLATWNISSLPDDFYSVRLRIGDDHYVIRQVVVNNNPVIEFTNPVEDSTELDFISLDGSAYCSDFEKVIFSYGEGASPSTWAVIDSLMVPIFESHFLDWQAQTLTNGEYTLKGVVYSSSGPEDSATVTFDKTSLFGGTNDWRVSLNGIPGDMANYGDFDKDGNLDIIIGTTDTAYIFDNTGTPISRNGSNLIYFPDFPAGDYRNYPILADDINNDGYSDIVAVYNSNDSVKMYYFYSKENPTAADTGFSRILMPDHLVSSRSETINIGDYSINRFCAVDLYSDANKEFVLRDWSDLLVIDDAGQAQIVDTGIRSIYQFHCVDLDESGEMELYYVKNTPSYLPELYQIDYNYDGTSQVNKVSLDIFNDDDVFVPINISSFDMNSDGNKEIVLLGVKNPQAYYITSMQEIWIACYDADLQEITSLRRQTPLLLSSKNMNPVYFDIDNNGDIEYLIVSHGLYCTDYYVWNLDGTPYVPGSNGYWTSVPFEINGYGSFVTVADLDNNSYPDIIVYSKPGVMANPDGSFLYPYSNLVAFDKDGTVLSGFPIVNEYEDLTSVRQISMPIVNDLTGDGTLNMVLPYSDGANYSYLGFKTFDGVSYYEPLNQVPMWSYDQGLTGIPKLDGSFMCGDVNYTADIDTSDTRYLLNFQFYGGPAPIPYESADMDCITGVDIQDLVWLVNYVNYDSAAPCDCTPPAQKEVNLENVFVYTEYEEGFTYVKLKSSVDLVAMQLEFASETDISPVSLVHEDITVKGIYNNGIIKTGVIDLKGVHKLYSGEYPVLKFAGAVELIDAFAVSAGNQRVNMKQQKTTNNLLPDKFDLAQNYPNPFNPTTTIKFALPEASNVNLEVYNILGQKVNVLVDSYMDAGYHSIEWNGDDQNGNKVSSGVYFYKIKAGDFEQSKKMMLLK